MKSALSTVKKKSFSEWVQTLRETLLGDTDDAQQ